MSSRTVPGVRTLLLAAGLLLTAQTSATARPIRVLDLDRDVPEADVIALGKITSSSFQRHDWFAPQWRGRQEPTPENTGLQVDVHQVKATVMLAIKGPASAASELVFRHRREPAGGTMEPNGFMSHAFQPGEVCLLVLRKETDGVLALPAPEEFLLVSFSEETVPTLPPRGPQEGDLDYVLRLLVARFEQGSSPDDVGIDALSLVLRSKAGRAWGREPWMGVRLRRRLAPLVDRDLGSDVHMAVVWMLRELGHPVPAAKIQGWILDPKLPQHVRLNMIGALSQVPAKEQVACLARVAAEAKDEEVARTAARQLAFARERLERETESERMRRAAKAAPEKK